MQLGEWHWRVYRCFNILCKTNPCHQANWESCKIDKASYQRRQLQSVLLKFTLSAVNWQLMVTVYTDLMWFTFINIGFSSSYFTLFNTIQTVWFLFYLDQSSNNICEMQGWLCHFLVILMDWRSATHCCPALWEGLLLQNCVLCLHPQKEECLEERESVGALCQEIEKATRERRGYNWLQCSPLTLSFRKRLSDLNSFYLICLDVCLAFWANT